MAPVSCLDTFTSGNVNHSSEESSSNEISNVLNNTTILITGAAGFIGVALTQRLLLDANFNSIRQVICIIRGETVEAATLRLPNSLQRLTKNEKQQQQGQNARLVVLNGDCGKPDLGLSASQLKIALKAQIVIHAAGDTRFTLPLSGAMSSIVSVIGDNIDVISKERREEELTRTNLPPPFPLVTLVIKSDLAYMTSRFSLLSYHTKTHIHISTTFVAWFLPDGSIVKEDFIQRGSFDTTTTPIENHVNTYFHAKTIAEGCVNAMFTPQLGRLCHGKAARILRLSTIGPSISFPRPAWGAGHPSSPLCAAIAAVPLASLSHLADGAFLDVIPVDIAVNQIIALTAATHKTHTLPLNNIAHPRNKSNPINQDGINVPVYNIASGLSGSNNIQLTTLNESFLKIHEPYIPEKNLMQVYRPFMIKKVDFSTARAAKVMQITHQHGVEVGGGKTMDENLKSLNLTTNHINSSSSTASNLSSEWSDPPIDCGQLNVDVAKSIGLQQQSDLGTPQAAWHKYITVIKDEMEQRGPRAEWTSFVD